jgi:hypothetical protein
VLDGDNVLSAPLQDMVEILVVRGERDAPEKRDAPAARPVTQKRPSANATAV